MPNSPTILVVVSEREPYQQTVNDGRHTFIADAPKGFGGDVGPNPYDLLLSALGTCTSITLCRYAKQYGLPLEQVRVEITHHQDYAEDCKDGNCSIEVIERSITLIGNTLAAEQRAKLMEAAETSPVYQTLRGTIRVVTH